MKTPVRAVFLAAAPMLLTALAVHAAAPAAKKVKLKPNGVTTVKGNLNQGSTLNLGWATKSSVACFPSVQNKHFDGKHVMYTVDLPAKSVLKIQAKPKDAKTDVSLWAYSVGTTNNTLPPSISSVVSCEASYGSRSLSKPFNPGKTESVELNAINNPYRVVIGVAGAKKTGSGGFTLKMDLETAAPPKAGKIAKATPIKAVSGKTVKTTGKIDGGTEIDLAWAANSSVACFPATKNDHFNGKHVAYSFSLPKYTTATVELIPKKKDVDLSLYAYSMGTTRSDLPPDVPSVVSCEASYGTRSISSPYNPGGSEKIELVAINNPYNAIIGVAGAQGIKKGDFELKVTLAPR